jgi:protein-tyrosine phosphatase
VRLLVVCTANVARSPLAEAMLRERLGGEGVGFASAGTRAREGLPAAEGSSDLAAERGLDLSDHRSRAVTAKLVEVADLVLTMSERQRDVCTPLAPGTAGRVFTLREFVRLLEAVDTTDAPTAPSPRLHWLRDQAHLARPRAVPAPGREDIADPIGREWDQWVELGADLDRLVGALAEAAGTTSRPV